METMSMMEMEEVCWRCEDKSFLCLEKHLDTRLASLKILEEAMDKVVQEKSTLEGEQSQEHYQLGDDQHGHS